ncbi:M14 family zinc carboxypeptidase [Planctomicrobium sp. SH664]|uniref:M14 family zinc carboxypeptidase n=1 Tax=Planctomicrobium sp. SH664 TaxID=3448125 RepID=UPI003F5B79F0
MKRICFFICVGLLAVCSQVRSEDRNEAHRLKVDSDFPGGSGQVDQIDQQQRRIRFQPTAYRDQGWACWWLIKVTGIEPGEMLTLDVGDGDWATPDHCFYRSSDGTWKQSSPGVRSAADPKRISFQVQVDSAEAWFAWGPPYLSETARQLVDKAVQKGNWVTEFNLATTRSGHPTPALRIREPGVSDKDRKGIWIQARQHAWGAGSSWVCEGVVDWILSDDPDAVALRRKADIVIVPIMDIDHVEQGAGGKGALPQDHNRDWTDQPYWRSVESAQNLIREMNQKEDFAVFIDLQNPDAQSRHPFFFIPAKNLLSAESETQLNRFLAIARKRMNEPLDFQGEVRESGSKYDRNWKAISKNWVSAHSRPGVISVTLETPWNTPHSTPDGYLQVGRGLAQSVAEFVLESESRAELSKLHQVLRPTSQEVPSFRQISGVYPHLTTYGIYSQGGAHHIEGHEECGIGAVVPWGGKLWMLNYAPHKPKGSEHKLFSIDRELKMTIHPESVGGTPAGRMIHRESRQLLIGPYLIDEEGKVRAISPQVMPIRITAIARHLTDPANQVYYIDMEGSIWEANVHTLAARRLFQKPVPGWHGKGGYTSQGRLIVTNNGELPVGTGKHKFLAGDVSRHESEAGVLAEWNGDQWSIVERRQFTDVTGPGGIYGARTDEEPVWAIGWDQRSLRLKLLENGTWFTYLLPKAAWCNDARHGWYTEWPRIREVGNGRWMMDMHGMFYEFPPTFSSNNTAGLRPIGSHLRYIPDFCDWNGRLVLASDETSIQGNPLAGQPQSNLWFGSWDDLSTWGPASAYGGPWANDPIPAQTPSAPFLVAGFSQVVLHCGVRSEAPQEIQFTVEVDRAGNGKWEELARVPVHSDRLTTFHFPADEKATWLRLKTDRDCVATAMLHLTTPSRHPLGAEGSDELFAALPSIAEHAEQGPLLYPAKENRNLQVLKPQGDVVELTKADLRFQPAQAEKGLAGLLAPRTHFDVDDASVILIDGKQRLRLPKGDAKFDRLVRSNTVRSTREVQSERSLSHVHGTFYEVPLLRNGPLYSWKQLRPVASHSKNITDYCSWNGLLVLSGLQPDVLPGNHVVVSDDQSTRLWLGAIDDLWKLGRPCGVGGPWKETAVTANAPSDPYLMTGYDKKTLLLQSDRDVTISAELEIDYLTGWHRWREFTLKANEPQSFEFEKGFSAHWIRFTSDADCKVTAQLTYE